MLSLGRRVIELSHTERTLKPHERRLKRLETEGPACVEDLPVDDDKTLMWIRFRTRGATEVAA